MAFISKKQRPNPVNMRPFYTYGLKMAVTPKLIKEYISGLKMVASCSTETNKGIHFWPEDGGIRLHRN
jgi:hypothetical protein